MQTRAMPFADFNAARRKAIASGASSFRFQTAHGEKEYVRGQWSNGVTVFRRSKRRSRTSKRSRKHRYRGGVPGDLWDQISQTLTRNNDKLKQSIPFDVHQQHIQQFWNDNLPTLKDVVPVSTLEQLLHADGINVLELDKWTKLTEHEFEQYKSSLIPLFTDGQLINKIKELKQNETDELRIKQMEEVINNYNHIMKHNVLGTE